jgi:putative radical SAM enzyme (TIGR03279 family)
LSWRVILITTYNKETLPEVYMVEPGSIADRVGILKGDRIVSINGVAFEDLIDYKFLISDTFLSIAMKRGENEWVQEIIKEPDTDLGIGFEAAVFDGIRRCQNKCLFCFIDQLPKGMRRSLYVKDDDYRLSVLCGNFVTLTNLDLEDMRRITDLHLSPLYISVHTTDPWLRSQMLGNPNAAKIMDQLEEFADAHVVMHTQIVLCPGINDGKHLDKTVMDLSQLWPYVTSIGIVPVGLTDFRHGLSQIRQFTSLESYNLVKRTEKWQEYFSNAYEYPLVFCSDEFYFLAGMEVPSSETYRDFPQLENGIGITRRFLDELDDVKQSLPNRLRTRQSVTIVTGALGEPAVSHLVSVLNSFETLNVNLVVVRNSTFGDNITVAGLLTGSSIVQGLQNSHIGDLVVIPRVMLRHDEEVFLDGMTLNDLEQTLCRKVIAVDGPKELMRRLFCGKRGLL